MERVQLVRVIAAVADGLTGEEVVRREGRIEREVSCAICDVVSDFESGKEVYYLGAS